ncbi:hypothetical protein A9Q99_08120 [Gammaproteobacteria bacterium 45_16_T64]|nr:hypothetical protein A9Q99_08120 [Gammaproteobacteria bacterium 45_16_T64]
MDLSARVNQLQTYLEADPGNTNLYGDIVDIYLQIGPLSKVKEYVNRGLAIDSDNPRLLFQQSTLHIAEGDYQSACNILQPLLDSGIDNPGVRYNLALALSMTSRMMKAKEILQTLCSNQAQRFFAADILMARLMHHSGELQDALSLANTLLEEEPNNGDLHGVISLLYLDMDDKVQALEFAELSQQSSPGNTESLSTIGHLALEDFESRKANDCFRKILAIQPKDGRAWLGLGLGALLDHDVDTGEDHLITATKYMPNHLGTWNTLAWLRIMKKDLTGARESIDIAMEKDRTFSESHGTLAVIQVMQGEHDTAERSIKIALRLDPMCISAHFAQTLLLSATQDKDDITHRMEELMTRPIAGGISMQQGLQRYASKRETKKLH